MNTIIAILAIVGATYSELIKDQWLSLDWQNFLDRETPKWMTAPPPKHLSKAPPLKTRPHAVQDPSPHAAATNDGELLGWRPEYEMLPEMPPWMFPFWTPQTHQAVPLRHHKKRKVQRIPPKPRIVPGPMYGQVIDPITGTEALPPMPTTPKPIVHPVQHSPPDLRVLLDGVVTDVRTPVYWDDIVPMELPWMQRGRQLKKPAHIMATPPKPVIKPVAPTSKDETVNGEWIPRWNPWYGPMGFPWFAKGLKGTPFKCEWGPGETCEARNCKSIPFGRWTNSYRRRNPC